MKKKVIAVIDSGVGGLSLLKSLTSAFPECEFIYLGDNDNVPYGTKSKRKLLELTFNNLLYLQSFNVSAVVFGCNTLSVSVFFEIKRYFPFPIFPIFPPFEKVVMTGKSAVMLATVETSKKYAQTKSLEVKPLECLATEIEEKVFSLQNVDLNTYLKGVKKGCNTIVLGCTHYNFVKNEIFNHLKPQKILDGATFVIKNVAKNLKIKKSLVKHKRTQIIFLGKNSEKNKKVWSKVVLPMPNL